MKYILAIALMFVFAGISAPAGQARLADDDQSQSEQDAALEAMKRGEIMDYAKIRRRAEAHMKGRLVGAKLMRTGRGWVYEVRVRQQNGAVVFAILDARTGAVVKS